MKKWGLPILLFTAVAIGAFLLFAGLPNSQEVVSVEVTWDRLAQMDLGTGQASPELQKLNHQRIRVPGFMVPLEDQMHLVSEFLLVPSPQACIHVPPPPSNQMIYVKMKNPVEAADGAIWVYGVLSLTSKKHMYGEASFELVGQSVETYQ